MVTEKTHKQENISIFIFFFFFFPPVEDIKQKVAEICDLNENIHSAAQARDRSLNMALKLSEKFYDLSSDVMSGLHDLKDNLCSQEPPGVDPETVKEQQAELAVCYFLFLSNFCVFLISSEVPQFISFYSSLDLCSCFISLSKTSDYPQLQY